MDQKKLNIKNFPLEAALFKRRSILVLIFIILFACFLIGRLTYLQIKNHRFYSTLSQQNLLNVIPLLPHRGLIYDRNGVLLAENMPIYTLAIVPSHTKNLNQTIEELNKIIPISADDLKQFHRVAYQYRPHQPIPLKLKLTDQEVARFYVDQYRFPSVSIQTRMIRSYPLGASMSNILGYVARINQNELNLVNSTADSDNKSNTLSENNAPTETPNYLLDDSIGKSGIEKYYEKQLRGVMGAEEAETDASGRIVRILKEIPPQAGPNLYLTIDSGLQTEIENAMGEENGSVVVIQPSTGQVLALVTKPSFDPNPFTTGISQDEYQRLLNNPDRPLYNRSIRGQFSPGSTIKPFFALLALDDNVIDTHFQIQDPGWFKLPDAAHIYRDWAEHGHGIVNVVRAIGLSCDVFFFTLAVKMGITHITKILNTFGFGERTGIDLPEEQAGLVPSPEWKQKHRRQPWYKGDTVVIGIGQGLFYTTPLQLAHAVATIAQRGKRFTPQLFLKSVNAQGEAVEAKPIPKPPLILKDNRNWDIVIGGMKDVINQPWGTAKSLPRPAGVSIAGKTGTQQVFRDPGKETSSRPKRLRNNHYFIAFAPVENPEIAIAVMIEHSTIHLSVAGRVLNYYFEHYHPSEHPTNPIDPINAITPLLHSGNHEN